MRRISIALMTISVAFGLTGCSEGSSSTADPDDSSFSGGETAVEPVMTTLSVVEADIECPDAVIYFDTASVDLDSEDRAALDRLAACIASGDVREIEVGGYSDPAGTAQYNRELGERRARTVADYLQSQGVTEPEIQIEAIGEAGATPIRFLWPAERRVEVEVEDDVD